MVTRWRWKIPPTGPLPSSSRLEFGASLTPDGVAFRVWAPAAAQVNVELTASGDAMPMERDGDGVWGATVRDAGPGSRYFYRLNGQISRPDPYSRFQPEGVHGPSEVVNLNTYAWHDADWPGLRIQGLVIYQAHVGSATPEGTLDSLISQLPRLQQLGVTAIQLLPLGEFPGTRNWGYDGVDVFAVSRNYGGPAALQRFVDAAHQHALGVILDVIYNHFGPDGNYLRDFAPEYFTDRYHTPWGDAINYANPYVRKLVVDNVGYWLREYHVDGLRFDATHAIYDSSSPHILAEASLAARSETSKPVVLIAETGENDVVYVKSVADGGRGFDAVYADDFHHSLRRYLAGDHEGYYAEFAGTLAEVARCIEDGWLRHGPPTSMAAWQFLYVLQNHDQVGNRAFGERLHHQIGIERFAAASALLLFLPFTPMLFMGQEFGASTPFQYFTDHNPELGRLVTEGRRREFKAFSAFADPATRERIPDPQAVSTFEASKLRLAETSSPPGPELIGWYAALLQLRRSDPVLLDQARERTEARALSADVLAVRRWHEGDERLLLVNFGDEPATVTQFGADWRVMLGLANARAKGAIVQPRSAAILGRSAS